VGSLPELGNWQTAESVLLSTSERLYPVWRTKELLLPSETPEEVQYKYVKIFGGCVTQWEVGPHRILDVRSLSECQLNCVEDVPFDIDDSITRRNSGMRARSGEPALCFPVPQSQMTSLETSRLASRSRTPLRTSAGQTPQERSPNSTTELENILRELMGLEHMNLAGRLEIRRAVVAVRSAIEAERSGGHYRWPRRSRLCSVVGLALLMVPLLPLVVSSFILWRFPSARTRKTEVFYEARSALSEARSALFEANHWWRDTCWSWGRGLGQAGLRCRAPGGVALVRGRARARPKG